MAEYRPADVMVTGPRELPTGGLVRVWLDTGSGPGHEIEVCPQHLALADNDDGKGTQAVYALGVFYCRG